MRIARFRRAMSLATAAVLLAAIGFVAPSTAEAAAKPGKLKVAVVQFLGGAAAPHDESAVNAAKLLFEQINTAGGIGSVPIELTIVDERGKTSDKVVEYRRLVQEDKIDVVIGYTSSSHCLGIAPVADELKTLTIFQVCANFRLFENEKYKYVFRTSAHAASENISAARYILSIKPDLKTIAGLNYDYAYGRDSWKMFKTAVQKLKPDVKVVGELWVKFLATDYSAEISKLQAAKPDVIHTVNWGAGLTALIKHGKTRGLFENSTVMITTGLLPQAEMLPKGVAFSGRGYHLQWPDPGQHKGNADFINSYKAKFGKLPSYQGHFMAQAVLGLKTAIEKAININGGEWPEEEQVIAAFENLGYDTPRGPVFIRSDHQAVHDSVWGLTTGKNDPVYGYPKLEKLRVFPAADINPPLGVKSVDWINSWPANK